jgi:branched-subunit amino acid transport protein
MYILSRIRDLCLTDGTNHIHYIIRNLPLYLSEPLKLSRRLKISLKSLSSAIVLSKFFFQKMRSLTNRWH